MSKSNLAETGILNLIFKNTDFSNIGDATGLRGSTTAGSLYIALYTSDPTDADTGTEATFGAYARKAVTRGAGWTVSGAVASNAGLISFAEATSGSQTITHIGIRTASSGGDLLFHAPLNTSRLVNTGTTIEFAIGAITITEA